MSIAVETQLLQQFPFVSEIQHEINKGDPIAVAAFGGGFTLGVTLVEGEY